MQTGLKAFALLPIKQPLSFLYCLIATIFIWLTFYPGVFSADSMFFISESSLKWLSDWHSLLIVFALNFLPRVEQNISVVIFVQIFLGLFGIRQFGIALARLFGAQEKSLDMIALGLLILLSSPLTPLSIYLATLWTDTWLFISFAWTFALLIEIYQESRSRSFSEIGLKLIFVMIFITVTLLVRSNTPILYPALVVCLQLILRRIPFDYFYKTLLSILPVAIYVLFIFFQYRVFEVKPGHPERAIYALDLASMIVLDPSICRDLSLQGCDLVIGVYTSDFVVGHGAIDFTFNQGRPPYVPYYNLLYYPDLTDEFFDAVRDHPLLFVMVKVLNYFDYISPNASRYFYQNSNFPAPNGFVYLHPFSQLTNRWFSLTNTILRNPVFRCFSFVHAVWLIINLISLAICARLARRDDRARFIGFILLVPASYYASYLIAFTSSEFRFMYPSMLIVQVITLTFLSSQGAKWLARRKAVWNH